MSQINFHNVDCQTFMASKPDKHYKLAIVDPPYQNNDAIDISNGNKHSAKRTKYHLFKNVAPSLEYFNELKRVSVNQIVWGGNYFGLKGGVIAWNKNGTAFGEGEVAICSTHNSVVFYEYTWNGMIQQNMKCKEIRIHPTQKPVDLYRWILKRYAKPSDNILDTHGGSMSSAIACDMEGYDLDICEIDKEYFDAGVKRFQNYKQQLTIF